MGERELPRDVPKAGVQEPLAPIPREVHRARFEALAGAFHAGEFSRANEDGSVTNVVSYERHVDPLDRNDMALLREFRLRAAAAGLREAFSPLVLPTLAASNPRQTEAITAPDLPHRPLTIVQLGYEKPTAPPETPKAPQP